MGLWALREVINHPGTADSVGTQPDLSDPVNLGVDEGLISGTLASADFRDMLHLPNVHSSEYASVKATISSMVQIGSVAGAGL